LVGEKPAEVRPDQSLAETFLVDRFSSDELPPDDEE
jgi:hypothetical protein